MYCSSCGTPNDDTAKFCQKCGTAVVAAPAAPQSQALDPRMRGGSSPMVASGKQYATGKNPTLAVVLSLVIVGVGQFYNGDVKKGFVMLGVAVLGSLVTYGLAWIGVAIWSAIDAYNVASGKSAMW